jgi:ABC-2 type transport system ATP-binding protein
VNQSTKGLLAAERLTKRYGNVVALNNVSFDIFEGITGILGENAAGKSTAIKIFLGLIQPTSGSARVLGEDVHENAGVRARLGYMPEHDCLPSQVSAAEFLTHMAELSGLPPTTARTRAADTLRHTGLFEERYRAIGGYSTGMKQRVKLAQALVHDPAFVFLDEPTAGLDPLGREEMLTLVRKTHREFGISVLLSSHLMADVERTCDRIIVLRGGQLCTRAKSIISRRKPKPFLLKWTPTASSSSPHFRDARRGGHARWGRAHHRRSDDRFTITCAMHW